MNQNNNTKELEKKIMSGIKSGKIKLRSKYIFWAKKLGLNSVLSLSIILAILFFNLVLFYMKSTDNLGYLSFGKNGLLAFLESFPYSLIIVFALFLLIAGYLITKTDWSYKKEFKYIALILVIIILLAGSILASTNLSENIERQVFLNKGTGLFFKPFFKRGLNLRDSGLVGEIYEIGKNYLIIDTPKGKQYLDLSQLRHKPLPFKPEEGQLIIAIGARKDDIFTAYKIRLTKKNECPMIKRGIHIFKNEIKSPY